LNWLIIRTDSRKEQYVARQVQALGFDAWVPVQLIAARPAIARRVTAKAHLSAIKEIPILPRRLFAAVPVALEADLMRIRHLVAVEHDADSRPLSVPSGQVQAFRETIDRENTAAMALAQKASRKQKAKWRSLKDALVDMIEGARQQMEQAA
jgi:hypothetical protein